VTAPPSEGLDAFGSEALPSLAAGRFAPVLVTTPTRPPSATQSESARVMWMRVLQWSAVIVVTAAIAVAAVIGYQRRFSASATVGNLTVQTNPTNLEVLIAGKSVGRTPLTLPLPAGTYDVEVGAPGQRRVIKASVTAGVASVQHLELAPAVPVPAVETGTLRVQTDPSNLTVQVDGVDRGFSPVMIERLEPGDHSVSVRTDRGVIHKTVKLQARESLSLIVSGVAAADAATTGGWLTVSSPVPMQLREAGKVIGTTESDRVMLPAGDHDVEILNEALGFRAVRKMRVAPGKTATTRIELPNGSLSLNAQPWAEVWIDGERVGDTPIGNLQRPIGTHQVVFRHPELGERRESVVITTRQPARLGVDLRKKQ
jgi:hypothetical protein